MFSVLAIFLILAAILWVLSEVVPMHPFVAKGARIVFVTLATIMLTGLAA